MSTTFRIVNAATVSSTQKQYFNIFWFGQAFSYVGDAFSTLGMPLLVLQTTGSITQMGIVAAICFIGKILAGLVSGVLVDRLNLRRLMLWCDIGRCVAYSLIPLCWWLVGPLNWLIYIVTLVGATLGMCFQIAQVSAIVALVEPQQLTQANGRIQATEGFAFMAGPALAGLLAASFNPVVAIGVDAATFAISALSIWYIRFTASVKVSGSKETGSFVQDWVKGLQFVVKTKTVRTVTLLQAASLALGAGVINIMLYNAKEVLGISEGKIGIIFAIASAGAVIAGLSASYLRRKIGVGRCLLVGIMLNGLCIIGLGFASTGMFIALLSMGYVMSMLLGNICATSLRQQITPQYLLGRVTSLYRLMTNIPACLGVMLSTVCVEQFGSAPVLGILGSLCAGLALPGMFSGVASLKK